MDGEGGLLHWRFQEAFERSCTPRLRCFSVDLAEGVVVVRASKMQDPGAVNNKSKRPVVEDKANRSLI